MLAPLVSKLCWKEKRKEKTTPVGVNLMRSQLLYRAAQVCWTDLMMQSQGRDRSDYGLNPKGAYMGVAMRKGSPF